MYKKTHFFVVHGILDDISCKLGVGGSKSCILCILYSHRSTAITYDLDFFQQFKALFFSPFFL